MKSRHALVGDIGGTNARLAIADIDELAITHFAAFRCEMFASLEAIIAAYMKSVPYRPPMAGFAIAGPVNEETLRLTNLPWAFTREDLRTATGAERVEVVNDFAALALALPYLTEHNLCRISGDRAVEHAARVVLGPGTGLGAAGLVSSPSGWIGVPSEGGHISFAAGDAREFSILEGFEDGDGHVSVERLISGPGIVRLYEILCRMEGSDPRFHSAAEIVEKGLARKDAVAAEALDYFVKWLGRFAGDMALAFGARGGVYLGGGIAPNILGALDTEGFRSAFREKGRLSGFLAPIPVYVIRAADAGLRGAAIALAAAVPAAG